jgi:O-antigen ligase
MAFAAFRMGRSSLRFVHLGIALLLLLATLKTQSRGGFLALCAIGLVGLAVGTWQQRAWTFAGVLLASLTIAVAGDDATKARFLSILKPNEDYNTWTTDGRVEVWKRGVGFMVTHPLLGVGIANYEIADGTLSEKALVRNGKGLKFSAAHNAYVQIGAELGFGGLIAFICMIVFAMTDAERAARRIAISRDRLSPESIHRTLLRTSVMSLSSILVSAIFLSFAYSAALMFFVAVTAGLAVAQRTARSREGPLPVPVRRRR